jgi:hypothetical protein
MIQPQLKVHRLIQRLNQLTSYIKESGTLAIQYRINDSYYLEKKEELQVLLQQLEGAYARLSQLQDKIEQEYKVVFCNWQADMRWLNHHISQHIS